MRDGDCCEGEGLVGFGGFGGGHFGCFVVGFRSSVGCAGGFVCCCRYNVGLVVMFLFLYSVEMIGILLCLTLDRSSPGRIFLSIYLQCTEYCTLPKCSFLALLTDATVRARSLLN